MDGKLIASTGFQRGLYNFEEINSLLREGLGQDVKEVVYINRRLRSALDVFKRGGHVTNEFKDQFFRLNYDNRREILFDVSANNEFNASEKLLDSKPVEDISVAELYRGLSKKSFVQKYQRTLNKKIYKRLLFHEITSPGILSSLENPTEIDDNLVKAQAARQVLDQMIGFCLSKLLQKKIKA